MRFMPIEFEQEHAFILFLKTLKKRRNKIAHFTLIALLLLLFGTAIVDPSCPLFDLF